MFDTSKSPAAALSAHEAEMHLEKVRKRYQVIITAVTGFFTTGLAALLVFSLDLIRENNAEANVFRGHAIEQFRVGVGDGDTDELRLARAEFWSRVSPSEDERLRWKTYEAHLQDVVAEKHEAQKRLLDTQKQIMAVAGAAEGGEAPEILALRALEREQSLAVATFEARTAEGSPAAAAASE